MYNIMTCGGWEETGFMGPCSMSWMAICFLVFVVLISRKQIGENLGVGYNIFAGFGGAIFPILIIVSIWGTAKWGLLAGIIGSLLAGIGVGQVADTGEGE